jgi:ornithine cyclodeaminase/alanine dehydrogenase-like protein (mu-crystallin family)
MTEPPSHPFAGRRTRVLGMEDVRRLLGVREAIDVQRTAFLAHAAGRTAVAPNAWLRLPGERRGWLKLLAGYDEDTSALGVKVLARFPENPSGANLGSVVLLFDDGDGFPLAVLDGVYLTAVRTGAGGALAVETLAREDARTVGLVGSGVVARFTLEAVHAVRPDLRSLRVASRSERRRDAFVAWARDRLGIEAEPASSVGEATDDADIVVTATNAESPILLPGHVSPGQLVLAMGIRYEVHPEVVRDSFVVADGRQEARREGKFSVALATGLVGADDLRVELGEVLSGTATVRPGPDDVVMFDSSGVAVQDVDVARLAWGRAEAEGVGTLVDLGLEGSP